MSSASLSNNSLETEFHPTVDLFMVSSPKKGTDGNQDEADASDSWSIDPMVAAGVLLALPVGGPLATLGARAALFGGAALATYFFGDEAKKKSAKDRLEAIEQAATAAREALQSRFESGDAILISRSIALQSDLEFEPGHPDSGQLYVRHPLAKFVPELRNKMLLPKAVTRILMAERTNEFIRLCVDLGATRVKVIEEFEDAGGTTVAAGVTSELPIAAEGQFSRESKMVRRNERIYEFPSRDTALCDPFDTGPYHWYEFEPDWRGLVHARIRGGCVDASVLLQSNADRFCTVAAKFSTLDGVVGVDGSWKQESRVAASIRFDVTFQPIDPPTTPKENLG